MSAKNLCRHFYFKDYTLGRVSVGFYFSFVAGFWRFCCFPQDALYHYELA